MPSLKVFYPRTRHSISESKEESLKKQPAGEPHYTPPSFLTASAHSTTVAIIKLIRNE